MSRPWKMATNYPFLMLTSTTFPPKDHEEWEKEIKRSHYTDDLNHIVYKDIKKQDLGYKLLRFEFNLKMDSFSIG
jgi:protein associated with RNAse G/E